MVNKNLLKQISLLQNKKYRLLQNSFVVEGEKSISEFIEAKYVVKNILITDELLFSKFKNAALITNNDMKKISSFTTPSPVLAVFEIPKPNKIDEKGLILALDQINDPGNLGTIIRLCDWFGVENIICSLNTVDVYNPKVIQATMGSLTRVNVNYLDLEVFLKKSKSYIYGAFMNGTLLYKTNFQEDSIIVMGNEANGISSKIEKIITHRITIPKTSKHQKTESLNVASATAIVLNEFFRK